MSTNPHSVSDSITNSTSTTSPLSISFATPDELSEQGFFAIHAAGIEMRRPRGVLLIGPSGVGKSTLAVSALRAGKRIVSDDITLLRQQENWVAAYPYLPFVVLKEQGLPHAYAPERLGATTGFCAIYVSALLFPSVMALIDKPELQRASPHETATMLVKQCAWPTGKAQRHQLRTVITKLLELPSYKLFLPNGDRVHWELVSDMIEGLLCLP